jgi:DNA modification methylase
LRLYNGDCLELMKKIPRKSVDLILTDLPYGITQNGWDCTISYHPMWKQIKRVRKDNAAAALFGTEPFSSYLRISNISEYKYDWIWNKVMKSNFLNAEKQPLRSNELISMFYEGQCVYNPQKTDGHKRVKLTRSDEGKKYDSYYGFTKDTEYDSDERYPHTIITFEGVPRRNSLHPTQKPVELMEYLIKTFTNEGDTVLDFAMGSGSTGVACVNLNRKFIGIEIDEIYFEIAKRRIKNI